MCTWQAAPCVLFFDEIDAIVGGGAGGRREGTAAESRVLATFLNELDGVSPLLANPSHRVASHSK